MLDATTGSACDRCPRANSIDATDDPARGVTAWWRRGGAPGVGFMGATQTPVYTTMDYTSPDLTHAATVPTRIDALYHVRQLHVGATAAAALDPRARALRDGVARSMHKVVRTLGDSAAAEVTHLLPALLAVWNPRFSHAPGPAFQNARIARVHPLHLALAGLWMFPYARANVDSDYILSYRIDRAEADVCAAAPSTGYTRPADASTPWRELSAFGSRAATLFNWALRPAQAPRDDMTLRTDRVGYTAFRATGETEQPELCIVTGKIGRGSMLPANDRTRGLASYATCTCEAPFGDHIRSNVAFDAMRTPAHARPDDRTGEPMGCTRMVERTAFPAITPYCLAPRFSSAGTINRWVPSDSDMCAFRNTTNFCGNGYWEHHPSVSSCVCARGFQLEAGTQHVATKRCVRSSNPCAHAQLGTCNDRGSVDPMTCRCTCTPPFFGATCEYTLSATASTACGSRRGTITPFGGCSCVRGARGGWDGNDQCSAARVHDTPFATACMANTGTLDFTPECAPPVVGGPAFDAAACAASAFFKCTCPPHRFGETCQHTMCPRDAQGRECGGPARGRCELNPATNTAACVCTKSCETGTIDAACSAAMTAFTSGNTDVFPTWSGCACDVDLRSACAPPRTIELCGSSDAGVGACRPQMSAISSTRANISHTCDCARIEAAGIAGATGQFCTATTCPVANGRVCNGRVCQRTASGIGCNCAMRLAGERLLKGHSCEIDATDACGSPPTIGSGLTRECSGRGTCSCTGNGTCACACNANAAGPKCATSLCPHDCGFGECVPGVGTAPARCACRGAYTLAPNGTCTANGCAHGAVPSADGNACICANPRMAYERRCLFADCPRDAIAPQEACGARLPFDEPSMGGVLGDTPSKQCREDGTCNCDAAYYVRANASSPCEWFCTAGNTAAVLSGGACVCKREWRGTRCDQRVCHATARVLDSGACACDPPTRMIAATGECRVRSCKHGLLLASGACRCFAGFTGDECDTSVCGNDAPWDGVQQRCRCELPITGTFCNQTDCGAQATYNALTRTCNCKAGWQGAGCTTRVCTGNYVPDVTFPSECICEPHFTGPDCTPPACENGEAHCFDGTCVCLCQNGFLNDPLTGQCTVRQCGNFGTWNPVTVCTCTPPFVFFASRIPRCQRACYTFGTARYDTGTGTCVCLRTHKGDDCAELRPDDDPGPPIDPDDGGGGGGGGGGGDIGVEDPIQPPTVDSGGSGGGGSNKNTVIGLAVGGSLTGIALLAWASKWIMPWLRGYQSPGPRK